MWLIIFLLFIFIISISISISGGGANVPGELYLGDVWFAQVKAGNKTIDTRPGPTGKYESLVGTEITYKHKNDKVKVKCTDVKHYKSIKDLIASEDLRKIAPHIKSDSEVKKNLLSYYTDEKISSAGGIYAIHFK
jgi:ASC-1-like (ASCH) protein